MAITVGTLAPASPPQASDAGDNQTHSYSVTTTADTDVVVILVGAYNTDPVTNGRLTCTWDGGSIGELDWYTQGGSLANDAYLQAFLVTSPGTAGSHSLVLAQRSTGGSITRDIISIAVPLEGADTGALPMAFTTNGAATGTSCSVTVTTTVGNLILTVGATYDAGQSAHTGTVLVERDTSNNRIFGAWNVMSTVADTTSEVIGWTQSSSDDWMVAALDFTPSSGGTSHTVDQTDAEGLTDSSTRAFGRAHAATDALGLTDGVAVAAGRAVTQTDTLSLTDQLTTARGIGQTTTDAEDLTDSTVTAVGRAVTPPPDALGLTDSVTAAAGRGHVTADAQGLADLASTALERGVTPTADPLGITDSTLIERGLASAQADTLGLSDGATLALGLATAGQDALGLTDAAVLERSVVAVLVDPLGMTDSVDVQVTSAGSIITTDSLGLVDSVVVALTHAVENVDDIGLVDSVTASSGRALAPSDALGLVDSVTVDLAGGDTLDVVDDVSLTDVIDVSLVRHITLNVSDALGLTDAPTLVQLTFLVFTDPLGLHDSVVIPTAVVVVSPDRTACVSPDDRVAQVRRDTRLALVAYDDRVVAVRSTRTNCT